MLETIVIATLITLAIVALVVTLALCKVAREADKALEHPEWIKLKK